MLIPELVRTLDLAPGTHPRARRWLSAASSLVCVGQQAYVIADDEHHLAHFRLDRTDAGAAAGREPVHLSRLFEGTLPKDKGKRKKAKPDLESLVLLPAFDRYPHGALLALGSGSRTNRWRGALLALTSTGGVDGPALVLDLAALYAPLQELIGDLNIEGAFVAEARLHLLQRGNKASRDSALITYELDSVLAWLAGASQRIPAPLQIQPLDLGSLQGVPLAPTDAAALAGGAWVFCAVAEDASDSYSDGACVASVVGIVDSQGHVSGIQSLQGHPKVEGIALAPGSANSGAELSLLLVTDADDPAVASQLLRVTLRRS